MTPTATVDTTTRRPWRARRLVDIRTEREQMEADLPVVRRGLDDEEFMREDEITCSSCHLIVNVRRLADPERRMCVDCVGPNLASRHGA